MEPTHLRLRVNGKTIYLKNPTRSDGLLRGIEVNKAGDEITGKGFTERLHIIDETVVTVETPMVMDRKYGELTECPLTLAEILTANPDAF